MATDQKADHLFTNPSGKSFNDLILVERMYEGEYLADATGRYVIAMCGTCGDVHEHTISEISEDPNLVELRGMVNFIPFSAVIRLETDPDTFELLESLRKVVDK